MYLPSKLVASEPIIAVTEQSSAVPCGHTRSKLSTVPVDSQACCMGVVKKGWHMSRREARWHYKHTFSVRCSAHTNFEA